MQWLKRALSPLSGSPTASNNTDTEQNHNNNDNNDINDNNKNNNNNNNNNSNDNGNNNSNNHNDLSTDSCSGCSIPCSDHPLYPPAIASKIETGNMTGSVKPHRRHIVIGQGIPNSKWPNDIKDTKGGYAELLAKELKKLKEEIGYPVKVTATDLECYDSENKLVETEERENIADWYIFPDQIKVKHVHKDKIQKLLNILFVQDLSIMKFKSKSTANEKKNEDNNNKSTNDDDEKASENFLSVLTTADFPHENLPGTWFLVCTHKLRDKRCGVAGPMLLDEINKYKQEESINNINTMGISHVGGHKFAGNVIVYPSGTWFGRVIPCHVPNLVNGFKPQNTDQTARNNLKPLVRGSVQQDW